MMICVEVVPLYWFRVGVVDSILVYPGERDIYHSERVETILPSVCFHSDSAMHHMLSVARVGITAHLICDEEMHVMIDEDTWE